MPKSFLAEVRERSVRMALDRLADCPSMAAACRNLAPKLDVGTETLRKWIMQAQANAGNRVGQTSVELDKIKKFKKEYKELREVNDVLKAATSFFARELDPRGRP